MIPTDNPDKTAPIKTNSAYELLSTESKAKNTTDIATKWVTKRRVILRHSLIVPIRAISCGTKYKFR